MALEEALAIARAAERVAGIGSFVVRVEAMEMVWTEGLKALTGVEAPNADAATHLERVHPHDRHAQRRVTRSTLGKRTYWPSYLTRITARRGRKGPPLMRRVKMSFAAPVVL